MRKLICSALLGGALLAGCASSGGQMKTSTITKTERWTCPAGTRPDARIREPNCALADPNAQANQQASQADQKKIEEDRQKLEAEKQALAAERDKMSEEKTQQQEQQQPAEECPEQASAEPAVQFEKRVGFATARTDIATPSKATLDEVAEAVSNDPAITHIHIGGHADITGNPEINDKIATARAETVKDYLVEQGVPEEKIETQSFSDQKPVAANDTKEGRALNRSVVIVAFK